MKNVLRSFVVVMCVAQLCASIACAETIRVSGGAAAITGFINPCSVTYEEETGHKVSISLVSPGDALIALEKGQADIVTAAMPFSSILEEAKQKGVTIDSTGYEQRHIGVSSTVVFVNKKNPISKLTRVQLRDLFSGKTTNWKELGGADVPVEIIWGTQTSEQNGMFNDQVLEDTPVTPLAIKATDYADIRLQISKRPGAIGIDPAGYVVGMIRVVRNTPKIYADVIAITKRTSSPIVYDFMQYVRTLLVQLQRF